MRWSCSTQVHKKFPPLHFFASLIVLLYVCVCVSALAYLSHLDGSFFSSECLACKMKSVYSMFHHEQDIDIENHQWQCVGVFSVYPVPYRVWWTHYDNVVGGDGNDCGGGFSIFLCSLLMLRLCLCHCYCCCLLSFSNVHGWATRDRASVVVLCVWHNSKRFWYFSV